MKTVFVTGGTRGIGRSIVDKFASEGCFVIFTYNSNLKIAKEIESTNVISFRCDNNDYSRIKEIKDELNSRNINIDILVNNAGIVKDKTIKNMSYSDWENVINTNLNAVFLFTKIFINDMIEKEWGRIINISSVISQTGGFGQSNYAATKAGINGFTRSIALEVASKGITVNAVAPGFIETDMTKDIPTKYLSLLLDKIPMRSLGKPEDVAETVFFLSTEKARYITGQVVGVNGGLYM